MVTLVQGRAVRSELPTLDVEGLPVGRQRLQLVVIGRDGRRSAPDELVVEISRLVIDRPPIERPPIERPPIERPPIGRIPTDRIPIDRPPIGALPTDSPAPPGTTRPARTAPVPRPRTKRHRSSP